MVFYGFYSGYGISTTVLQNTFRAPNVETGGGPPQTAALPFPHYLPKITLVTKP